MPDYQKLYMLLFNAFTDAIMQIDAQNYGSARAVLVKAQQNAEEFYLDDENEEPLDHID